MALSTNWFLGTDVTDNFICKNSGSDAQAGTQALPKKTLDNSPTGGLETAHPKNILRSGVYNPSNTGIDVSDTQVIGDTENVYVLNSNLVDIEVTGATTGHLENLNIRGVLNVFAASGLGSSSCRFVNCNIQGANKAVVKTSATGLLRTEKTLFDAVASVEWEANATTIVNTFLKCNFINCPSIGSKTGSIALQCNFISCYFDNSSFNSVLDTDPSAKITTFQNCVFDATCTLSGKLSGTIKDLFLAESPAINRSISGVLPNKGTFTYSYLNDNTSTNINEIRFVNCYWVDKTSTADTSIFNDISNEDYTLVAAATSNKQSVLYNGGDIIGKYGLSYKPPITTSTFSVVAPSSPTDATITNDAITLSSDPSVTEAVVQSANFGSGNEIKLLSAVLLTDAIRFFGSAYSFPNNALAVTSGSGALVDQSVYNGVPATGNVRYTFWLKYKDPDTGDIMPNDTVDDTAANWYEVEQGNIFGVEVDNGGLGNGDVGVSIANLNPIRAKEFQLRIRIRKDAN